MHEIINQLLHEFDRPLKNPVLIFSLLLFIILIAPILFKRIRIPGIIGLILSGVIVGPNGMNLLAKTDAITLFSTIGLLYIMFIAGLELDLADFKRNKHKSIMFGFFTFIIPILIGFPICYNLLGYDFNASFLTASMFATHTLVAYPIVSRLGIAKNEAVAVAVGGTILTDTAVLLILAVIKGNAQQGGLNFDFWMRLGIGLTLFSIVMFIIVPRVTKWFFRKLESEKHSHYIFVLSIVFFSAFLAEIAGVEPIIGAFAAGLVLNPLIPHSSALMNRIEYVGNALFIPFFLINVGMLVDLSILFKGTDALKVAGFLTVGAIAGKWLAAWFTQLVFKYSALQRDIIVGLSSAHAAATIAIILIGFNMGILDEYILNGTIILILVTCLFASFVTEKTAKKMAMLTRNEESKSSAKQKVPEKILLPVANFFNFEKLLDFAILIKDPKAKSPITMLSVVSNDIDAEANIADARKKIDSVMLHASASETKVDFITTIDFNAGSGITRTSKEVMASLIIMGWPTKKGFIDKLMGEVLEQVLENTDKLIFITNSEKVSMSYKSIRLIVPSLSELEANFYGWLKKVNKLAMELSISVTVCCSEKTAEAIDMKAKKNNFQAKFIYNTMDTFESLETIAKECSAEDMIMLISARHGAVSDNKELGSLPQRMENMFDQNHRIIIIP
jgi:Kef-type K+ transport system membrane component KefB